MTEITRLRSRNEDFWAGAAPGWIRHADRQDRYGRALGATAMDWLAPRPGERVLDIGCAAGGTAAELASRVGPTGSVVGVDLSPEMIDAARRRFGDTHPGLSFVAGDVETLGAVPGAPFDAAFSRMVVMLFADPVAGLGTIAASLRAGGRFAATVFREAGANPWLPAVMLGAAPHIGALPPLPIGDEPGPFAFADPARIRTVLAAAGFRDIDVSPCDTAMVVPEEPDQVAEWLIEVGPAGAAFRALDSAGQAAARVGAVRLLERFRDPGSGYHLPVGLWLVTAHVGGDR
jgi:SAM-dependent methyltransferase